MLEQTISRDFIVRRSRILFVDDERPRLIDDLEQANFAVDYKVDINGSNQHDLDSGIYDIIVLDFSGVGSYFGDQQGLSLLRHIKSINPSLVIVSYTSKQMSADQADFYRSADYVLAKDAGVRESRELIEEALYKSREIENVWSGLLSAAGVSKGSKQDLQMQDIYVRLKKKGQLESFGSSVSAFLGGENTKLAGNIVLKLVELGVTIAA